MFLAADLLHCLAAAPCAHAAGVLRGLAAMPRDHQLSLGVAALAAAFYAVALVVLVRAAQARPGPEPPWEWQGPQQPWEWQGPQAVEAWQGPVRVHRWELAAGVAGTWTPWTVAAFVLATGGRHRF